MRKFNPEYIKPNRDHTIKQYKNKTITLTMKDSSEISGTYISTVFFGDDDIAYGSSLFIVLTVDEYETMVNCNNIISIQEKRFS